MVIAVVVSLGLAALILTAGSPLVAAGVALAMLAFTAPDIREVAHQMHQARPGLAALAATVAVLHLLAAAALIAARGIRRRAATTWPGRSTRGANPRPESAPSRLTVSLGGITGPHKDRRGNGDGRQPRPPPAAT